MVRNGDPRPWGGRRGSARDGGGGEKPSGREEKLGVGAESGFFFFLKESRVGNELRLRAAAACVVSA